MARALLVRLASAVGLLSLSFFLAGLIPFLSAGPSSGTSFVAHTPVTSVNHAFKGDRLPLPSDINAAFTKNEPQRPQTSKGVPDGCDRAFSPITNPQLAHVYGRCTT
ncbi:MAG TPA: hypothetical protein VGL95_08195 [Acetobacteraceae bacterium]|jgi:hypothetical protein